MLIEGQFLVAAPPKALIRDLFDARLMASCLPGCESLEPLSDDRYRAVVVVGLAGVQARFNLQVEITRKDECNVWAVTRGEEGGNASSMHAESHVALRPTDDGTLVAYRTDVSLTGRLGRFGLGMMKKKAQSVGDEFAANLRVNLERTSQEAGYAAAATAMPSLPAKDGGAPLLLRWWRALLGWWRGERKTTGTESTS